MSSKAIVNQASGDIYTVFDLLDRHFETAFDERKGYLSQLSKGANVALDKIQAALPSCPPEIFQDNMLSMPSAASEFQKDTSFEWTREASSRIWKGWIGLKGYDPGFDIESFRIAERLKYSGEEIKRKVFGLLGTTREPITLTRTQDHVFHIINEHGHENKLIHDAWIENGKMCERLTSTAAKDHVFKCSEGVNELPLLKQACVYTPRIAQPERPSELPIAKIAGAVIGGLALIKAAQNFRAEGTANKVRGLAWAVFGVAAIALPNVY